MSHESSHAATTAAAHDATTMHAEPSTSFNSDNPSSDHNRTSADSPLALLHGPVRMDTNTAMLQATNPPPPPVPVAEHEPKITRQFSTAIGPSSDNGVPNVPAKDGELPSPTTDVAGPALTVTLLLTSGARHPFKLDSKYFAKRSVDVPNNDPSNLSVYKLKELILREWREDWEAKPSSPTSIRLINMGKLLDDKASMKDYKFAIDSPNVLHMTIKPQDFIEEEDAKGGKSSYSAHREGENRSPGCRCVIM